MGIDALVDLGEGVEERPGRPGLKRLVPGRPPFSQHLGHLGSGDHPGVQGTDHDVVCTGIADLYLLVPLDPMIQLEKPVTKLTHRTGSQLVKIPHGPPSMLPADHYPLGARKGHVVTDEDPRAGNKSGWEALVMTVTDTNHPGEVRDGSPGNGDVDDPEVAATVMGEAVR